MKKIIFLLSLSLSLIAGDFYPAKLITGAYLSYTSEPILIFELLSPFKNNSKCITLGTGKVGAGDFAFVNLKKISCPPLEGDVIGLEENITGYVFENNILGIKGDLVKKQGELLAMFSSGFMEGLKNTLIPIEEQEKIIDMYMRSNRYYLEITPKNQQILLYIN